MQAVVSAENSNDPQQVEKTKKLMHFWQSENKLMNPT